MYASLLQGALIGNDNPRNYFELFRPIYYFLIFSVFFHYLNSVDLNRITIVKKRVAFVFFIYLTTQFAFVLYQKLYPSGFLNRAIDIFYSTDKISDGLGRVVGLSANPNTLAICLSLVMFYFISSALCKKANLRVVLLILINLFLVFLTTSRLVLLVLVMIYGVILIFKLSWRIRLLVSFLGFILSYEIYNVIMSNPYYNELFVNLSTLDFYKIPSVYNRIEHYKLILSQVYDSPLLAYGPNKSLLSVGDNIYLFIYFQWGMIGLILQALPVLAVLLFCFFQRGEIKVRVVLSTLLIVFSGVAYETFYNLLYMPIYLFYLSELASSQRKLEPLLSPPKSGS
ncbi:O-antigen ligase family protein [Vibrio alginolyticus]|nr:O-antigen ligase family protein [Vibrio alginolyticus]